MLASFTAGVEYQRGDVDQDGQVSISDVTCLIDYLLSGTWGDEPVTPPEEHEWVDLGLPSGTLWATCNIGADIPDEYGDYFAWGETEPKDYYEWSTYKWCNGRYNDITKYCMLSSYGTVDNKMDLDPEDDAAYVNWGPSWRMPTTEQQQELVENCTWKWTLNYAVSGHLVTGPNGNTIFLPDTGYRVGSTLSDDGAYGVYWSRTLYSYYPDVAYCMDFSWGDVYFWNYYDRSRGRTVRAVRVSQN